NADVAIVQISNPPPGLKPLALGGGARQRQGDNVFAVGHPRGLSFTVTTGIVSAVRKTSELPRELTPPNDASNDTLWVQTNAAIAGGSRGGPLCDREGKVLGINTWITGRDNFAFAVHVSHLSALLNEPLPKLAALPGNPSGEDLGDNPL